MEASDVDEDYFTPHKSTPLANIFHDDSSHEEENPSLKYVPPKQDKEIQKVDEPKSSQCLYSSTLLAYEWNDNSTYSTKKVGLAVIKLAKNDTVNLLLYDSNKVTLSCTTIQPESEFKVKDNVYVSFFDDGKKYWNVSGSLNDIRNLLEILKSINVQLKSYSKEADSEDSVPCASKDLPKNTASETESSDYHKKKALILNRMANKGHAILPSIATRPLDSSDTSDTNDEDTHKVTKKRLSKSISKKTDENFTLRNDVIVKREKLHDNNAHNRLEGLNKSVSMVINKNVVPVEHTIIADVGINNDLSLLMREQRINNHEVRINIGRLTEKVDTILNKVSKETIPENFQYRIYEKLLAEYENKIKRYEELIKSKGQAMNNTGMMPDGMVENELEKLKDYIQTLESLSQQKDEELCRLKEVYVSTELVPEIEQLKKLLNEKEEEIKIMRSKNKIIESKHELHSKLKAIMNEAYKLLESHFESENNYTGCEIKSVLANVIRKVTIDLLNT